jgi:hypothetical protein
MSYGVDDIYVKDRQPLWGTRFLLNMLFKFHCVNHAGSPFING